MSGLTIVGRRINDPLKRSFLARKLAMAKVQLFKNKLAMAIEEEPEQEDGDDVGESSRPLSAVMEEEDSPAAAPSLSPAD